MYVYINTKEKNERAQPFDSLVESFFRKKKLKKPRLIYYKIFKKQTIPFLYT